MNVPVQTESIDRKYSPALFCLPGDELNGRKTGISRSLCRHKKSKYVKRKKTGTEIFREQTFGVRTCPPGLEELQEDIFGLLLPELFA